MISYADANSIFLSPLKQIKSRIQVKDVKCNQGFQLVIKNENGHPACVRPNTATRLLTHGWLTLEKFEIIQQNASRSLDQSQNTTTAYDNDTRYPTGSVPVHTSGPIGSTNVMNLPSAPNCTYSNYFCSMPANSVTPLPPIPVMPTISSNSNITKIIAIGMSPNPLKVGDIPQFTVTYQNISDKPIYGQQGCGSDLTYAISPDVNVKKIQVFGRQCAIFEDVIQPNQIVTDGLDLSYYKIIQRGLLNVTLTLNLSDNGNNWSNRIDTIQFNVNATNSSDTNSSYPAEAPPGYQSKLQKTIKVSDLPPSTVIPPFPAVSTAPLPSIIEPVLINYSNSNITKIIAIGMSPNPLKVGDIAWFTVTYGNISDKPIYGIGGCGSDLSASISPPSDVQVFYNGRTCAQYNDVIQSNQTVTDGTFLGYKIIRPGLFNVTLNLRLSDSEFKNNINSTIQFDVNATQ